MRKFILVFTLLSLTYTTFLFGTESLEADGNTLDTLKKSNSVTFTHLLNISETEKDTVDKFIDRKLEYSDWHLRTFLNSLIWGNDSLFYLQKKQELEDLKKQETHEAFKSILSRQEKVLLELCILFPEKALPYYIELFQRFYSPNKIVFLDNKLILNSENFIYFKAYLYSLLLNRFPDKSSIIYNLAAVYYNHSVYLINKMDKEEKDEAILERQIADITRFMIKSQPYMDKYSKLEKITPVKLPGIQKTAR